MISFFWILSIFSKSDFEVDGLTYRIKNNKATVVNCNITNQTIVIPSLITFNSTQYTVDTIDSQAFSTTSKEYTEIYFPHTLTDLGDYTFQQFKYLEKIGYIDSNNDIIENCIPPLVKRLGYFLFSQCLSLKKINVNNVQLIDMSCFKQCYALETFESGAFLQDINGESFESCYNLVSFSTESKSLRIIQSSFTYCQALTKFDFWRCELIDHSAFSNSGLIEADLSQCTFTTLETELFSGCLSLSSVQFPKNLVTIRAQCFFNCQSLTKLDLHDLGDHFTITQQAFQGCISLKSVIFEIQPSMLYEDCFFGCSSLESVTLLNATLTEGGTYMDNYVFYNCTSLQHFEFDKWTFLKIGDGAFFNCPLTESISFIGTKSPINFTISKGAFNSNILKSVDFRNCSGLQLVPNSFVCPNVNCVMIDDDRKYIAAIAFSEEIINGPNCPNHPTPSQSIFVPTKTSAPTETLNPTETSAPTETLNPTETAAPTDDDDDDGGDSKISKKTLTIIVSASATALVIILVIIVTVVVRRRRNGAVDDINSKPLITEDDPKYQ